MREHKKAPTLFLIIAIAALPIADPLASCFGMNEMDDAQLSIRSLDLATRDGPSTGEQGEPAQTNDAQNPADCHTVTCWVSLVHGHYGLPPSKIPVATNSAVTGFPPTNSALKSRITVPDTRPPIRVL